MYSFAMLRCPIWTRRAHTAVMGGVLPAIAFPLLGLPAAVAALTPAEAASSAQGAQLTAQGAQHQ
jgi:hypothetical protein